MNVLQIIIVLFFVQLFIVLHELGHWLAARIMKLTVLRVGFTLKPYPHFFVAVVWPTDRQKRIVFLFAGFSVFILLLAVALPFNFFNYTYLYYAFCIQAAIETNPFYSDFTIAQVTTNTSFIQKNRHRGAARVYKELHKQYMFTGRWYLHFVIWLMVILAFIKLNNLL